MDNLTHSDRGDFGHNRSKSKCFQVHPVTHCGLLVFLHEFVVYSIDSLEMMGKFVAVSIDDLSNLIGSSITKVEIP